MLSVAVTPFTCVEHWGALKSGGVVQKRPRISKATMVVRPYICRVESLVTAVYDRRFYGISL